MQILLLADADWAIRDCEMGKSPVVRELSGPSQGWTGCLGLPDACSVVCLPSQSVCMFLLRVPVTSGSVISQWDVSKSVVVFEDYRSPNQ